MSSNSPSDRLPPSPAGGTELNTVGSAEFLADEYQALTVVVATGSCDDAADCVDLDSNNTIDDACTWGDCDGGACNVVNKFHQADLGGSFGACPPDSFCNVQDRNTALLCFSGQTTCDTINIDAGGSFGVCPVDGFCNIFDANAALTCFEGSNTCGCGAQPEAPSERVVAGETGLRLDTTADRIAPGQRFEVEVLLTGDVDALQAYQLHLEASGGRRGQLVLEDIVIESRSDSAFADSNSFQAANPATGQVLRGRNTGDTAVSGEAYLATYTFRASKDAAGSFVIDVLTDEDRGDQTFLVSNFVDQVVVDAVSPVTVEIAPARRGRRTR